MKLIDVIHDILIVEYNKLGKGSWGSVYEKNKKIYKVTEDDEEIIICNALLNSKHTFKHFPLIYDIKEMKPNEYGDPKFRIIRKMYTPITKIDNLSDITELIKKYSMEIMAFIPNQKNPLPQEVKNNQKLYNTILGIINEFSTLNLPDYKFLDFHIENIGVDEMNNIILFDF